LYACNNTPLPTPPVGFTSNPFAPAFETTNLACGVVVPTPNPVEFTNIQVVA
jgi:hypothetical protein